MSIEIYYHDSHQNTQHILLISFLTNNNYRVSKISNVGQVVLVVGEYDIILITVLNGSIYRCDDDDASGARITCSARQAEFDAVPVDMW